MSAGRRRPAQPPRSWTSRRPGGSSTSRRRVVDLLHPPDEATHRPAVSSRSLRDSATSAGTPALDAETRGWRALHPSVSGSRLGATPRAEHARTVLNGPERNRADLQESCFRRSAQSRDHSSHRRGHWFDPSIAHSVFYLVRRPVDDFIDRPSALMWEQIGSRSPPSNRRDPRMSCAPDSRIRRSANRGPLDHR